MTRTLSQQRALARSIVARVRVCQCAGWCMANATRHTCGGPLRVFSSSGADRFTAPPASLDVWCLKCWWRQAARRAHGRKLALRAARMAGAA